ncbi:baseplate J/gp47 family protein [Desulfovibrio psychrotolerans]|uniref:Baseplate protein J-like barrel domain-containing protein n=1 Tax=Desulfovibrio psychrotolerans TaxID=415242 RepID=A0A7J0BWC2_9BACT|nr:baseplate J/gp47 family protein [Desulfovibrio psychrotolerans]GFM38009.1 hypothetical protein DSM19430T_26930 [Desulfovibrio psychrotolerans]
MAARAYIDETGFHAPSYPEVLEDLQAAHRAIFGNDVYLEPDSQEGQMLAVFALRIYDCYTLAGSVYNAYSPQTAQGAGLSRSVKINGLQRRPASYSSVDLRIIGQVGTIITNGIAKDSAGQNWLLPVTVTIPQGGEITVTAQAEKTGDVRAAAGEITVIATPTRGWQQVSNPAAAIAGAPVETDAALRRRQTISTALPSLTVFEGTLGAVASLPGVTRSRGYENDSDAVDANGMPPHSICLVVERGDATAIATAIAAKKTPGTSTYGDVAVQVQDSYGSPLLIRFYRPQLPRTIVDIEIRPLSGYLAVTADAIKAGVADYINALRIGDDLLLSKLYTPVNAADGSARTFDILSLRVATEGNDLAASNIVVPFNAALACAVDDVTVTVVEA